MMIVVAYNVIQSRGYQGIQESNMPGIIFVKFPVNLLLGGKYIYPQSRHADDNV